MALKNSLVTMNTKPASMYNLSVVLITLVVVLVTFIASHFASLPSHINPHVPNKLSQLHQTSLIQHTTIQMDNLSTPECPYSPGDLNLIINAIDRALVFFEANIGRSTVLDAAFGTRVLEAQILAVQTSDSKLPLTLGSSLGNLIEKSKRISALIIKEMSKKLSKVEEKETMPWMTTPGLWEWPEGGQWETPGVIKSYEPSKGMDTLTLLPIRNDTFLGSPSNNCIFHTFNCHTSNVTEECRMLYYEGERSLYALTHQVIYSLFAAKNKCYGGHNFQSPSELKNFQEKLCGKVWLEANVIDRTGFPWDYRDLFVEQVAICGMMGFPNFLNPEWMSRILSWQSHHRSGCFLIQPPNLTRLLQPNRQTPPESHYTQRNSTVSTRHKRNDAYLLQDSNEICSWHFTSVGIAALAMHLRFYFHTCFPTY